MTVDCLSAMILQLLNEPVAGKRVLEVGSQDVNGSIRPFVEALKPREYIGADMAPGKGVDVIVNSSGLIGKFGPDSFDLVISTSLLEHVRDWKAAVHNMKGVCRPGGMILLTTCACGFQYHGHPYDFWRYELSDLKEIFSDCRIEALEPVYKNQVLIKAVKPAGFSERGLEQYEMYSLALGGRVQELEEKYFRSWKFKKLIMRTRIMNAMLRIVDFIGSRII
ncbi:MAG: methyltransferase domain-containing protein [Candidatus Omnitrophota bacterium]